MNLPIEKFARAHAVNGPGINGQDDGAPQRELVQEIGGSGSVPQAERRKLVQEGGQVFRRVRPGQGQQGGDAESQLEGGFPFAGRARRDDDAVVLGNLAQACDQEFPADDENGGPDGAEPHARQVNEGGGNGNFVRQGVNELAESGDLVQAAGQVAVQPVRAGRQDEGDQCGQVSPGILVRDADCCREDDYQGNPCQGNSVRQVQHTRFIREQMTVRSKLFCRIQELNSRNAAHGKNQTDHGREKGWTEGAHWAFLP